MAFKFKLEKVLHHVRIRETMKRMEVSSLVQRVAFLERRKDELARGVREVLEQSHRVITPAWAVFQNNKISLDAAEVSRLEKLLIEEQRMLEKRKGELNRILMRKRGLDTLRDKRLAEHRTEESRHEQKQADENHQLRNAILRKG